MSRTRTRWLAVVAGLGFAAFLSYLVHAATTRSPLYDDAYNASIAKNVALGIGYASSYHEPVPFDPRVSVGPTVILPAALAYGLSGHRLAAPMIGLLVFNGLLLLSTFLAFRRFERRPLGPFLLFALLTVACTNRGDTGSFGFWFEVHGEVAGGLLAVLGALLVLSARADEPHRRRTLTVGFVALGLAILTKTYYAFGALVVLVEVVRGEPGAPAAARLRTAALALAALLAPFVAWIAWQLLSLPPQGWAHHVGGALEFFWSGGSGLAELWRGRHHPESLFVEKLRRMGPIFLARLIAIAIAAIGALILARPAPAPAPRPDASRAGTVLLRAAIVHLACLVLLLPPRGFSRHLMPGLFFAVPGFVLLAWSGGSPRARLGAAIGALLVVLALNAPAGRAVAPSPAAPSNEDRLAALRDTAAYLTAHASADTLYVGWGWWANRDLEYALPTAGNFYDLSRLRPDDFPGRRRVLVRSEFWNWGNDPALTALAQRCDETTLYRRDPFIVCALPR